MFKELTKEVEKANKTMYEQNRNINKEIQNQNRNQKKTFRS